MKQGLRIITGVAFGACLSCAATADSELLTNRGWSAYGGVPGGGQYSALAQINTENVDQLRVAWTHSTGHAAQAEAMGRGASYQVTPILANDLLYICTPFNRVLALDPKTGAEVWAFDPHTRLFEDDAPLSTCRGVIYWEADREEAQQTCGKRVYKADRNGRMFAVDADTGKVCTGFGDGGFVDLKADTSGGTGPLFLTSPQAVLGDSLIVAGSVGDNVKANSTDGVIRALDARTGALKWRLVTIPDHLRDITGGADVWPPFSVDVTRNMVVVATGSPSVDIYGAHRTDPIPYANAMIALDGETGSVLWHYQIVHHDLFDYDLPSQPLLVDINRDGVNIPAVVQITKMGTVFVFHRETGEPLFPIEERKVPVSDIPGERSAPTQPVPATPAPFSHQIIKDDDVFGLTFWDRNACKESLKTLRYEGLYTPASLQGSLIFPSPGGGGNWGGAAYDPAINTLVVKGQNFANIFQLVPAAADEEAAGLFEVDTLNRFMEGTPFHIAGGRWESPFGVPCNPPPWGELTAIDLGTGETTWRRPMGQVPFGPFGLLNSPKAWGGPISGGPIITAGGLIFMGGTMEGDFRALDKKTGQTLWSVSLPAPGMAVPMTYEIEGQQFVVIAAGGSALVGTELSDHLIAYALDQN